MNDSTTIDLKLVKLKRHRALDASLDKPRGDTRTDVRTPVYKFGSVVQPNGKKAKCTVTDLTENGARIMMDGAAGLPAEFQLNIQGMRDAVIARIIWWSEREAGVSFGQAPTAENPLTISAN